MRIRSIALGSILAIALAAAPFVAQQPASARPAQDASGHFAIDSVHSTVVFRINHLGLANFYGVFEGPEGSYLLDAANAGNSFVKVNIPVERIDSGNDRRDGHLKSPDFFNAEQFPTLTFESTSVKPAGTNKFTVSGNLTMLGVTKPVTAQLEYLGEGETRQGYKSGFEAVFTIKRSDFGMTKFLEGNALGDEVKLIVAVEGKRG